MFSGAFRFRLDPEIHAQCCIQRFNQCTPTSATFVSSPVSLSLFWLPFCWRGQSFPSAHSSSVSVWGRVSPCHVCFVTLPAHACPLQPVSWAALIVYFPQEYRSMPQLWLWSGLPSALPIASQGSRLFCWLLLQSAPLGLLSAPSLFPGQGISSFQIGVLPFPPQRSGLTYPVTFGPPFSDRILLLSWASAGTPLWYLANTLLVPSHTTEATQTHIFCHNTYPAPISSCLVYCTHMLPIPIPSIIPGFPFY